MKSFFLHSDIEEICSNLSEEIEIMKHKTIFFAGIAGFLGRYFVEIVNHINNKYDAKIKLIGVDNFVSSGVLGEYVNNYDNRWFTFDKLDLSKPTEFNINDDIDYVIHAAGIASPAQYKSRPMQTFDVAINGSKLLLELAKSKNSRYVFFSSSEIYGDPDELNIPVKESYKGYVSSMGPRACYDESKRAGETLAYIYNRYENLHTNVIRPFNVFGPGMQKTDYRVMPNFVFNAKEGKPLEVYGSGNQTRTYCYITDAITGFMKVFLLGKPGEAYNIGNPEPELSALELANIFSEVHPKNITVEKKEYPDNYPEDEPSRRCPSIKKAINDLKYAPKVILKDGVSRLIDWAEDYQE